MDGPALLIAYPGSALLDRYKDRFSPFGSSYKYVYLSYQYAIIAQRDGFLCRPEKILLGVSMSSQFDWVHYSSTSSQTRNSVVPVPNADRHYHHPHVVPSGWSRSAMSNHDLLFPQNHTYLHSPQTSSHFYMTTMDPNEMEEMQRLSDKYQADLPVNAHDQRSHERLADLDRGR